MQKKSAIKKSAIRHFFYADCSFSYLVDALFNLAIPDDNAKEISHQKISNQTFFYADCSFSYLVDASFNLAIPDDDAKEIRFQKIRNQTSLC
jgi:uncharacterized protein YneR